MTPIIRAPSSRCTLTRASTVPLQLPGRAGPLRTTSICSEHPALHDPAPPLPLRSSGFRCWSLPDPSRRVGPVVHARRRFSKFEDNANPAAAPEFQPPDATITGRATPPSSAMAWWYREPAKKFWEGLPIATGASAMPYGRVRDEVIPFNDETLWTGSPYDAVNPEGPAVAADARQLLAEEKFGEAADLANNLLSHPVPVVGRPIRRWAGSTCASTATTPCRTTAASSTWTPAIARVTYRIGNARVHREMFASYPDQVVVVRLTCDRPGQLTFATSLSSLHASATGSALGDDTLLLEGGVSQPNPRTSSKMLWQGRVRVIPEGGRVRTVRDATGLSLRVEKANAVTILLGRRHELQKLARHLGRSRRALRRLP